MNIGGRNLVFPTEIQKLLDLKIDDILRFIVELLLVLGVVLSIIFLILGGIQWAASGGSKEGIQKARGRIIYSIIGLIVILSAFFIINFIGSLFRIDLIKFPILFTPAKHFKPL